MMENSLETGPPDERLDRQLRIPGWDQEALGGARLGVAGDDPWLTGLFVAAAAALGLRRLTVVAPELDPRLVSAARGLNPELELSWLPGFFSHHLLQDLFQGCQVLVDLSHHALATKLLMNLAHGGGLALVRGFAWERDGMAGLRLFTYRPGREWRELGDLLPARQLPGGHGGDPGLALIIAGLVLEEVKKLLLGEEVTPAMVSYARPILAGDRGAGRLPAGGGYPDGAPLRGGGSAENRLPGREVDPGEPCPQAGGQLPLAVVGAGALGNFVGLGLAAAGFSRLTCIDPDRVEITNLNRQLLFWDAVGEPKAEVLARRLRAWFGVAATAWTAYLDRDTDLGKFAGIFDCTDNHESRIVLSEKCRLGGLALVSGGTGVTAGQVVVYDAARGGPTPAEVLGLYDLVDPRQVEARRRQRASCRYQPEPAVIMTNQVVGGLMVDAWRRLRRGEAVPPLFYDARSERLL